VKAEQRWPVAWAAGTTATLGRWEPGMPLGAAASRHGSAARPLLPFGSGVDQLGNNTGLSTL